MKKESVAARVRRGGTLLDKKVPGWYREIALRANGGVHIDVSMSDPKFCILGQMFSNYWDGLEPLGLRSADSSIEYGFEKRSGFDNYGEYELLSLAWEKEVFKRLRKDALGKVKLEQALESATDE